MGVGKAEWETKKPRQQGVIVVRLVEDCLAGASYSLSERVVTFQNCWGCPGY